MSSWRRPLPGSSGGFFRSSSFLLAGSIAAQAIPLAALPLVSRLYTPEAIGLQTLAVSWATVISVVITFRLDLAAVLPQSQDAAKRIVHAALTAMLVTVPVFAIVLAVFWRGVLDVIGSSEAGFWILFVIVLSVAMALSQIATAVLIRERKFARMATMNVANQGITQSLALALGVAGAWVGGPVLARTVGQLSAVGVVLSGGLAGYIRSWRPSIANLRSVAAEYRQFPTFNVPYSVISTTARDAPLIIFGIFASAATVGVYGLARVIMFVPTSLASVSFSPVFFRAAVDEIGTPVLERRARHLLRLGLFVPAAAFALVAVRGPEIFVTAFGEPWQQAGLFAAVLAPASWFTIQSSWIGRVFEVSGRQRRQLVMQIATDAVVILSVLVTLMLSGDFLTAVWAFAITTSVQAVVYFFMAASAAGFAIRPFCLDWFAGAIWWLAALAAVLGIELLSFSSVVTLWISVGFVAAATAVSLAVFGRGLKLRGPGTPEISGGEGRDE